MGIMFFLILFLLFILIVVPLMKSNRQTVSRPKTVEIKGLDGSILMFSNDGVSYFKDGNFKFFKSSEIKRFSFERLDENTYEIKLDNGSEIITVPVKKEEAQKLFQRTYSPNGELTYTPGFPWLGTILGTAAGFFIADLIANSIHDAVAHQQENQEKNNSEEHEKDVSKETETDSDDKSRDYVDSEGLDFASYNDEFETGDFFDDF
ncbi:hypothetical protein GFV12_00390 [Desulfurobacterium thermolithotrophum]|uniref:hypothetical protein n=1 Tax=Desulfurobacterium thermolithotrophum TaxID=64160 RepID=UPI0013D05761|nr:hypothetical protein [Desulfurobacterium thermolithotrophum]